jgi:hypothetical protein
MEAGRVPLSAEKIRPQPAQLLPSLTSGLKKMSPDFREHEFKNGSLLWPLPVEAARPVGEFRIEAHDLANYSFKNVIIHRTLRKVET